MDNKHSSSSDKCDGYTTGAKADRMEEPERYRYLSAEEVFALVNPDPSWTGIDLGSGTGFYTNHVAAMIDHVYAVDHNEAMQDVYRKKGTPGNVELVTAGISDIPLDDTEADVALSLWTFHHGVANALPEVARVLRPGGRVVIVDWSANGLDERERGPDRADCWNIAHVQELLLDNGFRIVRATERRESFVVVATRR